MNQLNRSLIFLRAEWRVLSFGLLFQFFSCFGRTFYIALFSPEIQGEFDLSPGEFSYIYSAASLTGVLLIPWLGKLIDEVDLKYYAISMVLVLALASFSISLASSISVLFISLVGLRITGGSMMNHTSVVTTARHFDKRRGIATAICSLGVPIAEAILPILVVILLVRVGWRMTWAASAILLSLIVIPIVYRILRPLPQVLSTDQNHGSVGNPTSPLSSTRGEVLRDPQFFKLAPVLILPTPMVTALFFHQSTIAEAKLWSLEWLATCFIIYAAATVVSSLTVGTLADRIGARTVLAWTVVPMIGGFVVLAYGTSNAHALVYMLCMGLTTGARQTITAAIWAEIYGTQHIGSIRSIVHTVSMLLAGLSPAVVGWSIDQGVPISAIVQTFAALLIASSVLAKFAAPTRR